MDETFQEDDYGYGGYEPGRVDYIVTEDIDRATQAANEAAAQATEAAERIPDGGTEGQFLGITGTGPEWTDPPNGIPEGGNPGQVLTRVGDTYEWADTGKTLPEGGTPGQVLTKTDAAEEWADVPMMPVGTMTAQVAANIQVRKYGRLAQLWIDSAQIPSGSSGTYVMGTIPTGYRPMDFPAITSASTELPLAVTSIDVNSSGEIVATLSSTLTQATSVTCSASYFCEADSTEYVPRGVGHPMFVVSQVGDLTDKYTGEDLVFPCTAIVEDVDPYQHHYLKGGWNASS